MRRTRTHCIDCGFLQRLGRKDLELIELPIDLAERRQLNEGEELHEP
jgi:hypothetical protein